MQSWGQYLLQSTRPLVVRQRDGKKEVVNSVVIEGAARRVPPKICSIFIPSGQSNAYPNVQMTSLLPLM
jgi:hypothetical protein